MRRAKSKEQKVPVCVFCGASYGAQFNVFNPRFEPFGTACVKCEETLPEGTQTPKERLEYLRGEIVAERISQGEILELEGLAKHIEPGDVLLLQWAGVPETVNH